LPKAAPLKGGLHHFAWSGVTDQTNAKVLHVREPSPYSNLQNRLKTHSDGKSGLHFIQNPVMDLGLTPQG
jgi:hypothetical protein